MRPQIFHLAKQHDWVLWELHEEGARLEDLFYSLTADREDEAPEGEEETDSPSRSNPFSNAFDRIRSRFAGDRAGEEVETAP